MNNRFSCSWDDFKKVLEADKEEKLLRAEYDKYLAERYKWEWKDDAVMDFDTWWRAMADNEKDKREGK